MSFETVNGITYAVVLNERGEVLYRKAVNEVLYRRAVKRRQAG